MSRLHPIVFWLAGVKLAFHLVIIRGYGWFRDEFYYIACGERLDWGYVDHPPLVAVVTAATRFLFGDSVVAIRLPAAVSGAATVVIAGLLAHELGARRFGQGLAALAVLVATIYLPLHHILSMNAWEPLLWAGVALFVLRGLDRGRAREWVYAGSAGRNRAAEQAQHAVLRVRAARRPRAVAGQEGPAHARSLADGCDRCVIFVPNIIWEVRHGWPTLEFMQQARAHKNVALPPLAFVAQQVLVMNPMNAVVWVTGLWWLLAATSARGWRFLGWGYLALLTLLIAAGGKDYYLAPYYPILFAAGGVAIERWTAAGGRRRWCASGCRQRCCSSGVLAAPLAAPVLPVNVYLRYAGRTGIQVAPSERHQVGALPQFFADMFGWQELVEEVVRVAGTLPPADRARAVIVTRNYGEAGAINFLGPAAGAPRAISGHNNYWLWGPGPATRDVLLILGGRREEHGECGSLVQGGTVACGNCMPYENSQPIWICRDLKVSIEEAWKGAKSFN